MRTPWKTCLHNLQSSPNVMLSLTAWQTLLQRQGVAGKGLMPSISHRRCDDGFVRQSCKDKEMQSIPGQYLTPSVKYAKSLVRSAHFRNGASQTNASNDKTDILFVTIPAFDINLWIKPVTSYHNELNPDNFFTGLTAHKRPSNWF